MAAAFARHKFTSRQAGQLYAAWREASPQIRQRLLEQPQLFLKAQREAEPQAAGSPLQELLRDLEMIAAIAHRANRRVSRATSQFEPLDAEQSQQARHQLDFARQELRRLAARIPQEAKPGKEQEHVESKSASHDSATACSGSEETRDRALAGHLSSERAQGASLQLRPGAGAPSVRRKPNLIGNRSWSLSTRCKGNLVRVHEELLASGAVFSYQALTAFCRRHGHTSRLNSPRGITSFCPGKKFSTILPHTKSNSPERNAEYKPPPPCLCYSRMLFFQIYPTFQRFEL